MSVCSTTFGIHSRVAQEPSVAITAILSLTLGIGATTRSSALSTVSLPNPSLTRTADRMVNLVVLNEKGEERWMDITDPTSRSSKALVASKALPAHGHLESHHHR